MGIKKEIKMNVVTLIPAYRLDFILEALTSCLYQSMAPAKIVVSDDSPDNKIFNTLSTHTNLHTACRARGVSFECFPGPKTGGTNNVKHLLERYAPDYDFFHILMDDDLILPTFYETHARMNGGNREICSISRRWRSGGNGVPNSSPAIPYEIESNNQQIFDLAPDVLAKSVFPRCDNWLGEYSHCVFHKSFAEEICSLSSYGHYIYGLMDIGIFLSAALQNKLTYTKDYLGIFRLHDNQFTGGMSEAIFFAHTAWVQVAQIAKENDLISQGDVMAVAHKQIYKALLPQRENYAQFPDLIPFFQLLDKLIANGSFQDFFTNWQSEMDIYLKKKGSI